MLTGLVATPGMRDVGLVAAQQIATKHVGQSEYLARSKDTLGAALTSSIRYASLLCNGAHRSIDLEDDEGRIRFWFDADLSIHDAAYEFTLALLLTCARRITHVPNLRPTEVHFVHQQPRDVTHHERFFRCRLRFDMSVSALVFPAELMELPLPGAEPTFISTRTLARRLDREHTSFQSLVDQARRDQAVRDLRETTRSIHDIAKRLGFASSQSFHRAFRRWTGTTAMSFRGGASQSVTLLVAPSNEEPSSWFSD